VTRGIVAITIALALLTGLVIGSLGRIGMLAPDNVPAFETRAQQLGRTYYEAVDHLLVTGDSGELRQVLSADFQNHSRATGVTGDAESLIADLQSLRNVHPGYRQTVIELAGSDSLVVASITTSRAGYGAFAGLGIELNQSQQLQEILSVRDGLIVERWSDALVQPRMMTIAATGKLSSAGAQEMRRWRFDPHAVEIDHAHSEMILIIENGKLLVELVRSEGEPLHRFRLNSASPDGIETSDLTGLQRLHIGDVLIIPAGSVFKLRNDSATPASLLSIARIAAHDNGPEYQVGADSEYHQLLAGGFTLDARGAGQSAFVGHATLHTGSGMTLQGIESGGAFVIPIDGMLTAEAIEGLVWTADPASNLTADTHKGLPPGTGAVIGDATRMLLEAGGSQPATFWVVAFVPIERAAAT
jgi:quercetin dioxygenase-like cupin family protein